MNIKEEKREIIYRFVAALITGMTLAVASLAWFSANKTVEAKEMGLSAKVNKNLVIAGTAKDLQSSVSATLEFKVTQKILKEATHDKDWSQAPNTGLKYVKNTDDIDVVTGLIEDTTIDYDYAEVIYDAETNTSRYYYDYVAYIGSLGGSLELNHLNVTLSLADSSKAGSEKDYQSSTSVDFYLIDSVANDKVCQETYRGTLNLAGLNYLNDGTEKKSVDLAGNEEKIIKTLIVPDNRSGSCLKVVMRFYFDGGLKKVADPSKSEQAYIYADGLRLGSDKLSVSFEGVEPSDE